ncbi:MAG: bifunctional oligoribonuclease/PAP phosphatase NrnA [Gemmataceae bacterium]
MSLDWSPFVEIVRNHKRFVLTTHVRPDADGLGSMLGLKDVFEGLGKTVRMAIASTWPPRYTFLDPDHRIERYDVADQSWHDNDVTIVLDTGTWGQLGDFGAFLRTFSGKKIVIDHHISQDDLGALAMVDTTAEATGRLVYEAIEALGATLTKTVANPIFAALATDTGWFRHNNTSPQTFALADKLMQNGADPTYLFNQLYEQNSLPRLKLTSIVLARLQVVENGLVAYTEVRRTDYAETGATPQDTEDLINYCRSLAGVEVASFFMEQPAGGVKVSFRSRSKVNVAAIAEKFGGGGHRLASGTILHTSLEDAKQQVLAAIRTALQRE